MVNLVRKNSYIIKIIMILCILINIIFAFTGCNAINEVNKDSRYIENRSKEIVKCFDNKDNDALKNIFCKKTQSEYDLDEQIKAAFDLYDGKSTSYKHFDVGTSGGTDNGEWVDKHIYPEIREIRTDANKKYEITYGEYMIYKQNADQVGVAYITLLDSNGELLAKIGWD